MVNFFGVLQSTMLAIRQNTCTLNILASESFLRKFTTHCYVQFQQQTTTLDVEV